MLISFKTVDEILSILKVGFDVNEFARAHFSGGGHSNAAGGKSVDSMEETLKKFEDLVNKLEI